MDERQRARLFAKLEELKSGDQITWQIAGRTESRSGVFLKQLEPGDFISRVVKKLKGTAPSRGRVKVRDMSEEPRLLIEVTNEKGGSDYYAPGFDRLLIL